MRIVVLGAGAMGSLVGALLSQRHDVALVGRAPHMDAVRAHGLEVSGATRLLAKPLAVTQPRDVPWVPELVVLTVKAYDTARALQLGQPLLGPATAVLSLQNGVGNLELVEQVVPRGLALAGVTTHGVTFAEPGRVQHAGVGTTVVGGGPGTEALAAQTAALLTEAGLRAEASPDIRGEVWAKAVVNAGINPLTAITGLRNGALLEVPALKELLEATVREAHGIAEQAGIALPGGDPVERARRVCQLTAQNKSSMLQDIEHGRRTEVDSICGAVVAQARGLGLRAPLNQALLALVKGIEASTRLA
jgi:2-dehydropantoate 2-reductase